MFQFEVKMIEIFRVIYYADCTFVVKTDPVVNNPFLSVSPCF